MKLRRTREQQAADANTSTGTSSSTAAAGASADADARPSSGNAQDDVFDKLDPRYKVERKLGEEGSVTNSLSMLTAIPEVDLGIKYVPSFSTALLEHQGWRLTLSISSINEPMNPRDKHTPTKYRRDRKG